MNEEFIFCTRCGEAMRKTQRNCLKCGQLNYAHPDNQYMKKYVAPPSVNNNNTTTNNNFSNPQQQTYVVGQGTINKSSSLLPAFNNIRPNEVLTDKSGNLTVCALVNILLFLGGLVLYFLLMSLTGLDLTTLVLTQGFAVFLIVYAIIFIEFYSLQLLYMKANHPWWAVFIPFFNMYVLYEITMSSGWIFLFTYIPIVGVIISLAMSYNLGKVFGYNPWLTLFFTPILIPIMAFSNTTSFNGIVYVSRTKKNKASESLYKWNKRILSLAIICVLCGIGILCYTYRDELVVKYNQLKTRSFIKDVETIMDEAKVSLKDEDNYNCSNGLPLSEQSTYYVQFSNAGAYFNISDVSDSSLSGGYYQGYIKVENPTEWSSRTWYYIAVDDTIYGISEVSEYELKNTYAKKYVYATLPDNVVVCKKNNS